VYKRQHLREPPGGGRPPVCYLDPRRIYPTVDTWAPGGDDEPVAVAYAAPYFCAVDGHGRLGSAVRDGRALIAATLAAEGDEHIGGRTPAEYFATHVTPARVRAWERAHHCTLPPIELLPGSHSSDGG
jgi:hypothetical protein